MFLLWRNDIGLVCQRLRISKITITLGFENIDLSVENASKRCTGVASSVVRLLSFTQAYFNKTEESKCTYKESVHLSKYNLCKPSTTRYKSVGPFPRFQ